MKTLERQVTACGSTELKRALATARERLLSQLRGESFWEGRLSSSALSTALAVMALEAAAPTEARAIRRGLNWLIRQANADGSFGDTPDSPGNLSTTLLALCALWATDETGGEAAKVAAAARAWVERRVGSLEPRRITEAVISHYRSDRTFSAPILMVCAARGLLGGQPGCWGFVPQLPFELSVLPRRFFAAAGMPVVSYAMPALIAIGIARHRRLKGRSPVALIRDAVSARAVGVLEGMQPENGGFLEATPLTAFVALGLCAAGLAACPVARRAVSFLISSAREDGSWPIDTNLATWLTTLSVNAMAGGGRIAAHMTAGLRETISRHILSQQTKTKHPFTGAAPGGWSWTHLPGGVPDADDTAGALLALANLDVGNGARVLRAARAGAQWLIDLSNSDGGIPTFCRGWGRLPFDRSCPDITAHSVAAWSTWSGTFGGPLEYRMTSAISRAVDYLAGSQQADGSWLPLWFGNQSAQGMHNPTYGTARVVAGLEGLGTARTKHLAERGRAWLAGAQNEDGGWGGDRGVESSIEETALAVGALAFGGGRYTESVSRGVRWIVERTEEMQRTPASPIGLYFASLWYSEEFYPLIFSLWALERVAAAAGGESL